MTESPYNIQDVVRRTGLSAHVIRIWERRYGAVTPERTGTQRRRYSQEQIERLTLLRDLTQAGQSIGHIAQLPLDSLRALVEENAGTRSSPRHTRPTPESFHAECLAAVRAFDSRALEEVLRRAELELGSQGALARVAAPLAHSIGSAWRDGTLTAAHEHFASAVLRAWLSQTARTFSHGDHEPGLLVATPAGQLHEIGALLVAAQAANLGWHVIYLGAGLPAAEIAGAARQKSVRAVALSLVYPEDDLRIETELVQLRALLPSETSLIVGGRAAAAYQPALERTRAIRVATLGELGAALDTLRSPKTGA